MFHSKCLSFYFLFYLTSFLSFTRFLKWSDCCLMDQVFLSDLCAVNLQGAGIDFTRGGTLCMDMRLCVCVLGGVFSFFVDVPLVPVQPSVCSRAACWCLALFVSVCLKRGKFKCCTFSEWADEQSAGVKQQDPSQDPSECVCVCVCVHLPLLRASKCVCM